MTDHRHPLLPPDTRLGFFGGGMMAEAIIKGLLSKNVLPDLITVCERYAPRRDVMSAMGVTATADATLMLDSSNVVIVAVKPDAVQSVLADFSRAEIPKPLMISICAGVNLETLHDFQSKYGKKVVRVMPNTPCLVGEGASAFCMSDSCTEEDRAIVTSIMGAVGFVVELPEKNLDAVTGLSGSGPAYVYMFIEALADGGVLKGLPRSTARTLAAQMVFGSAKMVVDAPDVHPAELRNRVESPGGTTIAGSQALEEGGFRASIIAAVAAATERSKELGR